MKASGALRLVVLVALSQLAAASSGAVSGGPLRPAETLAAPTAPATGAGPLHPWNDPQTLLTPPVARVPSGSRVGPGQAMTIGFDPPAASVDFTGPGLTFALNPEGTEGTLVPINYQQGLELPWSLVPQSRDHVVGQPASGVLRTLPALSAVVSPREQNELGLEMPLSIRFNTPPADRVAVAAAVTLVAPDPGAPAPVGSWTWSDPSLYEFTPQPKWAPHTLYQVVLKLDGLKGALGNTAEPGEVRARFSTGADRWITVDLGTQTLTAFEAGQPVRQFLISSGTLRHQTVTGHFHIYSRVADAHMRSPEGPGAPDYYDLAHVPWTQYFYQGFALHGAWWHNNWGHPMSHGCVNVSSPAFNNRFPNASPDAEFLWSFANLGTPVIVSGQTPQA